MSRIIRYEFPVELHTFDDEDYYDDEEFEYEVSDRIVQNTLIEIFADFYGLENNTAEKIILDYDLLDMIEIEFEEQLDDCLSDICYWDALKAWEKYNQ